MLNNILAYDKFIRQQCALIMYGKSQSAVKVNGRKAAKNYYLLWSIKHLTWSRHIFSFSVQCRALGTSTQ
jgi:hypothetical protein